MRLTVHAFLTLDGVMQSPGSPEEDPSDGFAHGGWAVPYVADETFGGIVSSWFERTDALLFGRRTFEIMAAFWPQITDAADPVARTLNAAPKYVVSSTLTDPTWGPATVVGGDPVAAVARLKEEPGGELQVHGCARLAATLHAAGLVDEYRLIVFPVSVGSGRRLFAPDAPPSGFRLLESRPTPSGGVYSVLQPTAFSRGDISIEDGAEVTSIVE